MLFKIQTGQIDISPRESKTVEFYAELFLASKKLLVKESTYVRYESIIRNQILPIFGKREIASLRISELKKWFNYWITERSNTTAIYISNTFSAICNEAFYDEEIFHQICLTLFFGAMIVLVLYNLFIFFFTKDISYLFYISYLVAMTVHHALYVGVAQIYLLTQEQIITLIMYASIIVNLPVYTLTLFSKTFLKTKQYPLWDKIINY